jgi:hypothetical protein
VTIDFSASTNAFLIPCDSEQRRATADTSVLKVNYTVLPLQTKLVAKLCKKDPARGWKYCWKISSTLLPAELQDLAGWLEQDKKSLSMAMERVRGLGLNVSAGVPEIMEKCVNGGCNFVDLSFPPEEQSICGKGKEAGVLSKFGPITFRRPNQYMEGQFTLFDTIDGINPADIIQGNLGNCWLLSAISVLAEHPPLIESMFLTKHVNEVGVYALQLYKNGIKEMVIVDDYFPCHPDSGPIFSKNKGNGIWVSLLEKAIAKLHGSYTSLASGKLSEAFIDLTGFPADHIKFYKIEQDLRSGTFFNSLLQYHKQGFLMAISTRSTTKEEEQSFENVGLAAGHAYAILKVMKLEGNDLFYLRNPWGRMEWTGAWSDTSDKWTARARELAGPALSNGNGTFWMCIDDITRYFKSITICRLHQGWYRWETEIRLACIGVHWFVGEDQIFIDPPSAKVKLFMRLQQEDTRASSSPYTDICLTIASQDGVFVGEAGPGVERDVDCGVELEAGVGYVLLASSWGTRLADPRHQLTEDKRFALTLQSSHRLDFRRTKDFAGLQFYTSVTISKIMATGKQAVKTHKGGQYVIYSSSNGNTFGFGTLILMIAFLSNQSYLANLIDSLFQL